MNTKEICAAEWYKEYQADGWWVLWSRGTAIPRDRWIGIVGEEEFADHILRAHAALLALPGIVATLKEAGSMIELHDDDPIMIRIDAALATAEKLLEVKP